MTETEEQALDAGAKYRAETAAKLRDVAELITAMADALAEGDDILGYFASEGIANHLPGLPKNVRDALAENLTDEAARSFRADVAYIQQMGHD